MLLLVLQNLALSIAIVLVILVIYQSAIAAIRNGKVNRHLTTTTEAKLKIWAWWVEIVIVEPSCTYYFRPFTNRQEAQLAKPGYIEDLVAEKAQCLSVRVKWCQPSTLTSCQEDLEQSLVV